MLKKPDVTGSKNPRVFVFPIFEVKKTASVPETKEELLKMLKTKDAIPFHQKVCASCHSIPHSKVRISPHTNDRYVSNRAQ